MRKAVFTIVGSMLISVCAVQAQQSDTNERASKSKSKRDKYKTEQSSRDKSDRSDKDQTWQQQSDRMGADQTLVIIDVQEVPSTVRQKLEADDRYSGWEKATVYHNTRTGDYVFIPQPFRLDKEGNEQEMTSDQAWQYNNQYSQQNQGMSQQNQGRSEQNQDMSAQEQAQNQMGEIPTTASEDETSEQADGQQPSNSYRTDQDQQSEQHQQQNSQSYRPDDQYNTANMVEVEEDQIPQSLRTTLQESEYEGWNENGKLYRNPSTSEFVLIIDSDASEERRYRFDANGERADK